jgi:hypothetical protein
MRATRFTLQRAGLVPFLPDFLQPFAVGSDGEIGEALFKFF